MTIRTRHRSGKLLLVLVCVSTGARVLAQWAVENRPAVGQVNPQVNTEIYGRGTASTAESVRYTPASTSVAMESESRYAVWSAGATPSSVRMSYNAIGPMAAGGPLAYVPPAPSYTSQAPVTPPPAMGAAAYSNSSIRYSTPNISPIDLAKPIPPPQISSALVSPGPINGGPINSGPINATSFRSLP